MQYYPVFRLMTMRNIYKGDIIDLCHSMEKKFGKKYEFNPEILSDGKELVINVTSTDKSSVDKILIIKNYNASENHWPSDINIKKNWYGNCYRLIAPEIKLILIVGARENETKKLDLSWSKHELKTICKSLKECGMRRFSSYLIEI